MGLPVEAAGDMVVQGVMVPEIDFRGEYRLFRLLRMGGDPGRMVEGLMRMVDNGGVMDSNRCNNLVHLFRPNQDNTRN